MTENKFYTLWLEGLREEEWGKAVWRGVTINLQHPTVVERYLLGAGAAADVTELRHYLHPTN